MSKPIFVELGTVADVGKFLTTIKIDGERELVVDQPMHGIRRGDKVAVAIVKVDE